MIKMFSFKSALIGAGLFALTACGGDTADTANAANAASTASETVTEGVKETASTPATALDANSNDGTQDMAVSYTHLTLPTILRV